MLTWEEKIELGMKLIAEGCNENYSWADCDQCPFDEICSIIEDSEGLALYSMDRYLEEKLK